ncbi:unnamed protein product [Lupinus luteus]|uniref:Uncharacterized protein n=1 Tax=Lupinus luteus TaxID=3873 RepID=A0AAV1XC00_LUPLU
MAEDFSLANMKTIKFGLRVEHHVLDSSNSELDRMNVAEEGDSKRNMDVETLMGRIQALLATRSNNTMRRFEVHENNLNSKLGGMVDSEFEYIHTHLSRLESNFPRMG